jgi:S-layer protein
VGGGWVDDEAGSAKLDIDHSPSARFDIRESFFRVQLGGRWGDRAEGQETSRNSLTRLEFHCRLPSSVTAGAAAVAEGASATFTVDLANRVAGTSYSVKADLSGTGTAATPADYAALTLSAASITAGWSYVAATGVLTASGTSTGSAVFTSAFASDSLVETGEGVKVTLSAPTGTGAVLGTATTASTAITDVPVTYTLTPTAGSGYETAGVAYTVTASVNVTEDTPVAFTLIAGGTGNDQGTSLTNANDFAQGTFNPSTVTILAGTKTATYTVTAVNDSKTETPETYSVQAVVAGQTLTANGTVLDGTSAAVAQTYTLTTAPNTFGSSTTLTTQVFDGSTVDSFSSFDALTGGAATNDSLNANLTVTTLPTGGSVTGIESAELRSTGVTFSADVSGWTGLTSLTTANSGATGAVSTITAATTTNVNATVASTTGGALTISGGKDVTTTQTGSTGGALTISGQTGAVVVNDKAVATAVLIDGGTSVNATITGQTAAASTIGIGATTKPTGAITLNATTAYAANGTQGAITVKGGSTVSITDNLVATPVDGSQTVTGGAIGVTGGSATTSVTVKQTATATAQAAVTGVAGVEAVAAVTAAPGTQGVGAVTAANYTVAKTATTGVVNGAVTIADANASASTNTIATAALEYAGAVSAITSNALNTLSLKGGGTLALNRTAANSSDTFALTVDSLTGANKITDTNNEIKTLNVTTTGANSTLAAFADTGLTKLTVAGDKVLTLSTINGTLTSIEVSGAAGFNDGGAAAGSGFAALAGAATLKTTSSGAITAVLDATTQTFVGSTGKDTITIASTAEATKVITGGSGTTDELILAGGAYALTSATGAKVTGFETLGVRGNVTGTIDTSQLGSFSTVHVVADAAGTITFSKVAKNATVNIDAATTSTTVGYVDATGVTDVVTVNLGSATSDSVNFGTLVLKDANAVGVGTVNLVSNGLNFTAGDATPNFNTMVLTDNGLSTLNFSGTQGLTFTTLNQATTQATSMTINNTNTSAHGLVATLLTNDNLGSLTFTGTGETYITTLTDGTSTTLTLANTGTQTAVVTAITTSAVMTSLTLSGNVQVGTGLVGSASGVLLTNTGGITISGATDHAAVRVIATGAALTNTDNITLGNGNNSITNTSSATDATVNITVGTGSNYIKVGNGFQALDSKFNINLGTHTVSSGIDSIEINNTAGANFATVANNVITGATTGDKITFLTDLAIVNGGAGTATLTATATVASATSEATAIAALAAVNGAHAIAYGVYGGNTYVATSISGTEAANDVAIVKIVGTHTISFTNDAAGGAADYITLLS